MAPSEKAETENMIEQVRRIVKVHGRLRVPLETLGDRDSLWEAGLASFAAVQLMLALEDAFEIEFAEPDGTLFQSIHVIATNVQRLKESRPAVSIEGS